MKMRTRVILVFATIVGSVAFFLYLQNPSRELGSKSEKLGANSNGINNSPQLDSPPEYSKADQEALNILRSIYTAPIDVYGHVVDENGRSVAGAKIEYSLNDKYFKSGTKGKTHSGPDGRFRIQGSGGSVWLRVQHEGYFWIPGKSEGSIPSGTPTSLAEPAVFVLRTKGKPAQLTRNEVRRKQIPVDGSSVGLNLKQPKLVLAEGAPIEVRVWVTDETPGKFAKYRWRAELRILGGGWLDRPDHLSFEAPLSGYQEVLEVSMMEDNDLWRSAIGERELFFRLSNGTYGRAILHLGTTPKWALISFQSWWNESGERNLQGGSNEFGRAE